MKRKTCFIVGFDGLDECIAEMAIAFYTKAGYQVQYGAYLRPAELLVVLRGSPTLNANLNWYNEIHLYGYVCRIPEGFLESLRIVDHKLIVCHKAFLPTGYEDEFGLERVIIRPPPVIPDFWYVPGGLQARRARRFVHIGNCKAWLIESDAQFLAFVNVLRTTDCHVFGKGWEPFLHAGQCKGYLDMTLVSSIYSETDYALGLMYPEQRKSSFSSRFFQAPLAGTHLLTEAIPESFRPPGLILVDWTDLPPKLVVGLEDPREESYEFWRKITVETANLLQLDLLERLAPCIDFNQGRIMNRWN